MPPVVKNKETEDCLRELLRAEHYTLNRRRRHGEMGVDIYALRDDESIHIEVIGYKKSGPARAKDFFQAFFQAVSRLNDGAVRCVMAMPHHFETGLPRRVKQHRKAWIRIGEAFPELEIWLINIEEKSYVKYSWTDWDPA